MRLCWPKFWCGGCTVEHRGCGKSVWLVWLTVQSVFVFVVQVVAEAKAVFGADGKQTASRAGADGMAYTLSGMWVTQAALWVALAVFRLG